MFGEMFQENPERTGSHVGGKCGVKYTKNWMARPPQGDMNPCTVAYARTQQTTSACSRASTQATRYPCSVPCSGDTCTRMELHVGNSRWKGCGSDDYRQSGRPCNYGTSLGAVLLALLHRTMSIHVPDSAFGSGREVGRRKRQDAGYLRCASRGCDYSPRQ